MRYLTLYFFIFYSTHLFAGGEPTIAGAKQASMAYTGLTLHHIFSAQNNIANTAFLKESGVGIFFNNRYLFAQLNELNAAYVYQNDKIGAFSTTIKYWGYNAYNESTFGFGYARKFNSKIAAGLKFNYHHLAIQNNGSKGVISFNLGLSYAPLEKLRIGVSIFNPAKLKIENEYKETLSTQFGFGLSYHPTDKVIIAVETQKDLKNPFQLKLGANYDIHEYFSARIGGATNPTLFSFGFGTHVQNLEIDIASTWDINLGYSPQISLQYTFKKHEEK